MVVDEEPVGVTIVNAPIEIPRDALVKRTDSRKMVSLPASDNHVGDVKAECRLMGGDVGPRTRRSCLAAEMMFCQQPGRGYERPPRGIGRELLRRHVIRYKTGGRAGGARVNDEVSPNHSIGIRGGIVADLVKDGSMLAVEESIGQIRTAMQQVAVKLHCGLANRHRHAC
ncbi:MAG: hypothetical protein AB1582_14065 [Pseudomonadota bacterium]